MCLDRPPQLHKIRNCDLLDKSQCCTACQAATAEQAGRLPQPQPLAHTARANACHITGICDAEATFEPLQASFAQALEDRASANPL